MKSFIAFLFIAISIPAMAQTMEARRAKAEMLQRTIDLENHAKEAKRQFRALDIAKACTDVAYLKTHTRAHTNSVLNRMNSNKRSVRRMQDEAVRVMQIASSVNSDCLSENHNSIDPELAARMMHEYADHMHDHRVRIEDRSVEFDNSFDYEYEY